VETLIAVPTFAVPPERTKGACNDIATLIVNEAEAVRVSDPMSAIAVIVNVEVAVTVSGVPEIVPVEISKFNPSGRVPLME
jgi:hypothetical protein